MIICDPQQTDHTSHSLSNATSLHLTSLSLQGFRNYTAARITLDKRPVVLAGRNGAGKTNVLEAISLLTPGRGLRRAKLADLDTIQQQATASNWAVAATVHGIQGEVKIGTGRDPESLETDKRTVRIDGKTLRSQAELGRHVAMIWLTPQMEQLFNDGNSAQRKFLDRLVYSFDTEHASRMNEYEYAMRERNRLLQNGEGNAPWLDALEQSMAETACAIASARLQAISSINHAIMRSTLNFPKAHLSISGIAEDRLFEDEPAITVEEALKRHWHHARRDDAIAGRTLAGVHRSELTITHIEKAMPAESCSTGEQKAVLLSIILAQARAAALWKGLIPLILLDEVISHLDSIRKLELFEEICQIGAQTWMTGTDVTLFADLHNKAQYFQVADGQIIGV
ncbi:MAG: DNA replication/repair protein RecF [Rickettsiales bacterium]|nr:DNA replication/repair protein RecF [Rickettsiales bacterium]